MLSPFDRSFFLSFCLSFNIIFYLLLNGFLVLVFCFVFLCLFDINNPLNLLVMCFIVLLFVIK